MASILLVDDDNDFRTMTVEILRPAGHTVNDAPDGKGRKRGQIENRDESRKPRKSRG